MRIINGQVRVTDRAPVVARARGTRDEGGFSMITVILVGMVAFLLAAVMAARTWSDSNQVGNARQTEQALNVAESAIDDLLFEVVQDQAYSTAPNDNSEAMPAGFASVAAEEAWVRGEAATSTNLVTVDDGQWVAIKPPGRTVAYAVGYVPSRVDPQHTRVIRIEYDYAATAFEAAIVTNGDLNISGNPVVNGTRGSVHTNRNLSISGAPSFSGFAAAANTAPGNVTNYTADDANSGGGKPVRTVANVNPRDQFPLAEYLLCKNGAVRAGPAYTGVGTPADPAAATCTTGDVLDSDAVGSAFLGWKKTGDDSSAGAKWDMSGNTGSPGVFYIQEGSAYISGNAGSSANPWTATVIAEARVNAGHEPGHCGHVGGDIVISGNPTFTASPRGRPFGLVAGRDLSLSGNPGVSSAEALFVAHEQLKISGDPHIYGALVVNDVCDSSSSAVSAGDDEIAGNPTITFNGTFDNPFASSIRITRWQEL
jgi:hypothetical protein